MDAPQRGLELLKGVNNIGFTEFTSGLVSSTFDTLITSTLTQLEAYADLVTSVSKSVAEYKEDTFGANPTGDSPASDKVRNDWIQSQLVDAELVEPDNKEDLSQAGNYTVEAVDVPELVKLFANVEAKNGDSLTTALGTADNNDKHTIKSGTLHEFVGELLSRTAEAEQDLLVTILRLGMQKLVISNGHIRTKLTFRVNARHSDSRSARSASSSSTSVSGGAGFSWGPFGARASYGRHSYRVNVVNENSYSVVNLNAEIIGEVEIHFRTETFPTVEADTSGGGAGTAGA